MKERLVLFETAKLAKEKQFGMTDNCYIQLSTYYYKDNSLIIDNVKVKETYESATGSPYGQKTINDFKAYIVSLDNSLDDFILAPTQSLLQKWLREIHDIVVYILPHAPQKKVHDRVPLYSPIIWYKNEARSELLSSPSYETALERGLEIALKNI